MAYKQVGGKREYKYVKYSECEEGQVLAEGVYLGAKPDQYDKPAHLIKQDDETIQVLNSSGQLDYTMENEVTPGDYVRVTFEGVAELTDDKFKKFRKKGEDFVRSNQFLVEVDDERRSKVKASIAEVEADGDDTTDDSDDADSDTEEDSGPRYSRTLKTAAKPTTSKAKVQAREEEAEEESEEEETPPPATQKKKTTSNDDVLNRYRRKA